MNISKSLLLAFCLFFMVSTGALTSSVYAQDVQWEYDIKSGMGKAEAENKLVLLHFSASWCRPCQALEKFVFPNLEVARSINENVIPIHIDVDKQQTLVTEYGVTAVPFDVIITPGGRVISKQKSPLDSNGYRRMMAGLSTPVKELEDNSKVALAQKLNEFTDQFNFKPPQISEFKDHTPAAPSHQPPAASAHSAKLDRRSNRIANPFFGINETAPKPKPKSVSNSFTASPIVALDTAAPNKFANELSLEMPKAGSLQQARKEIQLDRPVIKSEYEVITGAEQEKALQDKQKTLAQQKSFNTIEKIAPNALPEMSFQDKSGSATKKLLQPNPPGLKEKGIAANVPPTQVQQDRFFQVKTAPGGKQGDKTRIVPPSNSAQALLKPVHQIAERTSSQSPQIANRPQVNRVQQLLQPQPQARPPRQPPTTPQTVASNTSHQGRPALGLKGKCPVTLLQEGKWIQGDAKFGCIHRDRLYMFADAQKLETFRSNPDYFSPILAGYDPVVFHQEGRLVEGIAQHGVFMGKAPNQRVLLFRDAQTRALFQSEPTAYMNTVRQAMNVRSSVNAPMFR